MQFSERLVAARKAKGFSQEALAEALGVSRQAVSKWETGESKPDLDNLIALCEKLELNIEYLCFGKEEEPQPLQPEARRTSAKGWQIVIVSVVSVVCLTIGAAGGFFLPKQDAPQPPAAEEPAQTQPDYNALLAPVEVVNVRFSHDFNTGNHRIFVMPSAVPEGLEMQLLIENVNSPDLASITKSGTFDGNYFTVPLGESIIPGMEYRITGVFTLGNAQIQIPLVQYSTDREFNSYSYTRLWEE